MAHYVSSAMASPNVAPLTFDDLAQRFVRDLAKLIHSGAVTERRLAGIVGVSQPHLHNVVNGLRKLTPTVADLIMDRLDWSLLDLVESAEAQSLLNRRQASLAHGREIPLSRAGLGIGFAFPGEEYTEITVPNSWLARAEIPVAVAASADSAMEWTYTAGDILLVDRAHSARTPIHDDALYVVRWNSQSVARWLRFGNRGLYLVTDTDWAEPLRWPLLMASARQRLEIVEGKIIAVARRPDDTFLRPVPPSASN